MKLISILICLLITISSKANAGQISFDCDVPADRFSLVTGSVTTSARIEGVVSVSVLRRGDNIPVAGARLTDIDERKSVGFQLIPKSRESSEVILNLRDGVGLKRYTIGEIDTRNPVRFSLNVTNNGEIKLNINDKLFTTPSFPLTNPTWAVFCSTGEFKFSEILF